MRVFNMTSDTTLASTTPVETWNLGVGAIYGAAIDNGFMWINSGGGNTYGFSVVPEPGTFALLAASVLSLLTWAWCRRK